MRIICAVLLLVGMAGARAAETSQQRGKRAIDQAVAALGGDRFLHMRDRVEEGRAYSFYNEKISGLAVARISTQYLKRPDPIPPDFLGEREREAFGKKYDDVILFANGTGYELTFRGARPLSDIRIAQFKDSVRRNIFYILRERLGEPGLIFESRGSDFLDNRPVEIVDITDAQDKTVTVYFDRLTKLPVRQKFFRRDPIDKSRLEEVTVFAKYRDVGGGVMWPWSIWRERNGEKIFELFSESVEIDKDLQDDLFTLPADMKILKKQE